MFSRKMEKLTSFLGTQSELKGDIAVEGVLRLDGTANGKLKADQVILSASACLKGDIVARKIFVGGSVDGILRASDLVEIGSKGKVKGEIYTDKLVIIKGGEFNGRIQMKADESRILDFESGNQVLSLKR